MIALCTTILAFEYRRSRLIGFCFCNFKIADQPWSLETCSMLYTILEKKEGTDLAIFIIEVFYIFLII